MVVNMNVNDPTHELFLNPSDNPNNILVSALMNGENCGHWKKAMEVALIAKNKLGFASGTYSKLQQVLHCKDNGIGVIKS